MKTKVNLKVEVTDVKKAVVSFTVYTKDINELPDITKPVMVEITPVKKKRSLNANAYAWAMMDKIAKVVQSTKEEIYKRAIKAVGVFADIAVKAEGYEKLKDTWERKGIGYICEKIDGTAYVIDCRMYYGSSTYNSSEMARLINWIVGEAESLGIETITPKDRGLLIEAWRREHDI